MTAICACTTLTGSQATNPASSSTPTPVPLFDIPRVSVQEAKLAYDNHAAVFVDVRAQSAYEEGHIANALSIPLTEFTEYTVRVKKLDPKQWIIPYCT